MIVNMKLMARRISLPLDVGSDHGGGPMYPIFKKVFFLSFSPAWKVVFGLLLNHFDTVLEYTKILV
jgi:hypothetical protein